MSRGQIQLYGLIIYFIDYFSIMEYNFFREVITLGIKEDIKSIIVKSGWTLTDVVKALNEKYSRNDSVQNLSNKLSRGTLKYREALEIAEIIGYSIEWVKRD